MIRRPPRSTQGVSSAASDVYKRQYQRRVHGRVDEKAKFCYSLTQCKIMRKQIIEDEEAPREEKKNDVYTRKRHFFLQHSIPDSSSGTSRFRNALPQIRLSQL
eukprot:TRINITY_DN9188_c0_g1_i2.p2 TRINITY_DN9188_c0_g1~~TRINITY_DN9188_c0_g1_i2.p2  ORF type:complete len:103 (-),score=28.18 TRINITY_DN9188_c0_g1_i2:122-430(-)